MTTTETENYYDRLDKALDTFEWAYQNREYHRGDIALDRDTDELVLHVSVADSEDIDYDPTETPLVPLEGRFQISRNRAGDPVMTPQEQIRAVVHAFVCHEADEQLWFNNERIFYPHQDHPQVEE